MIIPIFHTKTGESRKEIALPVGIEAYRCAQGGCGECQNGLLRTHEKLIHLVVKRQGWGEAEYDDLVQEGRIALWRAVLRYRPELGYAFSTYAYTVIRRRVWVAAQQSQKGVGWLEGGGYQDQLGKIVEEWQAEQVRQALQDGLASLPERQRRVIERVYGLNGEEAVAMAEIGREWGITRERVRQIREAGLALLRLPVLSVKLRGLCERNSRSDYRQGRKAMDAWRRQERGK